MSAYDKLKVIDARIRAGTTTLVDVLDALRVDNLTRFSREQVAAATAQPEPPAPEPEVPAPPAPKPASLRDSRRK